MAIFFVSMFAMLAISFSALTETNLQMSRNHQDVTAAQASAESGLEYANYLLDSFENDLEPSTYFGRITDDDTQNVFELLTIYVKDVLYKSAVVVNSDTKDGIIVRQVSNGSQVGTELYISSITFASAKTSNFSLQFRQYDDDPYTIQIISTGNNSGVNRSVGLNYSMMVDRSILDFGVASRSRIIMTGDSTIDSDVFTSWQYPELGAPFEIGPQATIDGSLNTMLSEAGFPMDDLHGEYDGVSYDNPDIVNFDASDFDMSMYADVTHHMTSTDIKVEEYFPHAPGDYTQPLHADSAKLSRMVIEGMTITDWNMPTGHNALFRNCTFEGVLFVGSGGFGTNNIRFDNCTFNGVIVTEPANNFTEETWKKNVLYFTGDSRFDNQSDFQEATILAPNFNVNIGNATTLEDGSDSVLKGVVLGGVVDIRGNARIDGTVISMGDPDPDSSWTSAAGQIATNIGFSGESGEATLADSGAIVISPDENNMLPMGIKTKIIMVRDGNSYVEY
jgi:hypothetical protein